MKNKTKTTPFKRGLIIASCLLALAAGTASAAEYSLCAGETSWTMPDGAVVPVWSFGEVVGGVCTFTDRVMTITVPDGDPGLTIHLTNNLQEPVSLHILGQALSNNGGPTFVGGRVMSFAHETAAGGGTADYIWNDLQPGTHLLQSGTHPAKQVQMGLYAVVAKDTGPSEVYPGVSYDRSAVLVFHEIDPFIHDDIIAGTYTGSIHREARYFLINGAAYPDIPDPILSANIGKNILLRFVNAGLDTHVPQMLGAYMTLVARDGIPLAVPEERHGFEMPAGQTVDAIFTPEAEGPVDGKYPVYDAILNLSNSGAYQGNPPGGGMLAYIGTGVSEPPVAIADDYATDEDIDLVVPAPGILGNDTDPENDSLTATLVDGPVNGALTLNPDGSFLYTPAANYSGSDGFTYLANDGASDSLAPAVVTLTIAPVNDAPVANADDYSTDEEAPLNVALPGVLGNDTDAEGDALEATVAQTSANGSLNLNSDGSFTYTPNTDFNGLDSFSYIVNDGQINGNTAIVSLTVNPINDAPTAVDDSGATSQDTPLLLDVLANDVDIDGDPLTVAAIVDAAVNGDATVETGGAGITYTPEAGFTGADSFTYTAGDGQLNSNIATVSVTVMPVNNAPNAADDQFTTDEDAPLTIAAPGLLTNDSDSDGDPLTAVLVQTAASGTLTLNADGSFSYAPNPDFNGADSFTYAANDGQTNGNTATVSLTVDPVNDAPVAVDDTATVQQDSAVVIDVLNNDSDVDGDALTAAIDTGPANGTALVDIVDWTITYTPNAGFIGTDSFTYTANDGFDNSNIATVTITVEALPVNQPPVAVDDSVTVPAGSKKIELFIDVLSNDSDPDGTISPNTVTAAKVSGPGSVTPQLDGRLLFTNNGTFNNTSVFTYQVQDDQGALSNTATVTITAQ